MCIGSGACSTYAAYVVPLIVYGACIVTPNRNFNEAPYNQYTCSDGIEFHFPHFLCLISIYLLSYLRIFSYTSIFTINFL
jgi:hypothetical protein